MMVMVAPLIVSAAVHVRHICHRKLAGVAVHLGPHGGLTAGLAAAGLVSVLATARVQVLPRPLVVLVETVRLRLGGVAARVSVTVRAAALGVAAVPAKRQARVSERSRVGGHATEASALQLT